jgi:hypothetical protein
MRLCLAQKRHHWYVLSRKSREATAVVRERMSSSKQEEAWPLSERGMGRRGASGALSGVEIRVGVGG